MFSPTYKYASSFLKTESSTWNWKKDFCTEFFVFLQLYQLLR